MHNSDYYREQANYHRLLAAAAETPPQNKIFWNWRQHVKKSPMRSMTVAQADNQICH